MTPDPESAYRKAVEAIEERIEAIRLDLDSLRRSSEAVNADAEISFSLEDIEAGWDEAKRFGDLIAKTSPHLAEGVLRAHLRSLDGWYGAGRLLSRSEVVSRRFGPKAHAAARAAKARRNSPVHQAEADVISKELAKVRSTSPDINPYAAAPLILNGVNERLKSIVIDGRRLKVLSETTIARRILRFSL
ncbi:hypothetical protein [Methylobacterium sp. J-077]|uniref:hypothetical protein n=1 Tax=Methylobacterium sp. J-077 TaxID=2836656 RepID=UPI001FB9DB01|nr:hypothetical protein [Methylobacterium sp. J-077]MCJ2125118.1 hypothetical protein [Methylobacterium sp. J-077]